MKFYLLAVFLLSLSLSSFAGSESHGGTGVRIDGNIYLLDFVESGIERDPYIAPESKLDPLIVNSFEERLKVVFKAVKGFPNRRLARKLAEIHELNVVASLSILKGIEMLNWRVVNMDLSRTSDGTNILLNANQVQLAVREGQTIRFASKLFSALDDDQKVGLAIHEIIYALISLEHGKQGQSQNVTRVREITAYLFGEELHAKGAEGLIEIFGGSSQWSFSAMIPRNVGVLVEPYRTLWKINNIDSTITYGTSNDFFRSYHMDADRLGKKVLTSTKEFIREGQNEISYNPGATVTINSERGSWSLTVYKTDTESEVFRKVSEICKEFDGRSNVSSLIVSFTFESIQLKHDSYIKGDKTASFLSFEKAQGLEASEKFPLTQKMKCDVQWLEGWVNSKIYFNSQDFK